MTKCNLGMLILSVSLCFTVAFLGQLAMPNPKTNLWFQGLIKPSFYPPDWVFGPVWSVLYLMMGVALWLVWRQKEHTSIRWPVVAFFVQLAANGAWTPLFFGLQQPALALLDIAFLWAMILWTLILFYRVSRGAGFLLLPYFLWVSFAVGLNGSLAMLNGYL